VALDPAYAPAWAGLAIQLAYLAYGADDPHAADELRGRALDAAERAVAADPELAEGYSARGYLRGALHRDWRGAEEDLERALAINPGDPTTQRRYGILRSIMGRPEEAIAAARRAIEIDPLNAANWSVLGDNALAQGQLALAGEAWRRALEIAPEFEGVSWGLALLTLLQGRPAEALAAFERGREEADRLAGIALAQHALGHDDQARAALAALAARHGDRKPHMVAGGYAFLGDRNLAFAWIDRAIARGDAGIVELRLDPLFASLRSDPRFEQALRKLNLSP
jgi:serine/threonine-protein kinase